MTTPEALGTGRSVRLALQQLNACGDTRSNGAEGLKALGQRWLLHTCTVTPRPHTLKQNLPFCF